LFLYRRLVCTFACLFLFQAPISATPLNPLPSISFIEKFILFPFFSLFVPHVAHDNLVPVAKTPLPAIPPWTASSSANTCTCSVRPIPPINGEEARDFEAAAGTSDVVNLQGLTPATALALGRFERHVASLGGTVALTYEYRPPAYQAHLQMVWDRWRQLRFNQDPGCAVLKAQVQNEFQRHQLLLSQRPVDGSDHTRGIGFDANVMIPWKKGRPSLDRIALVSGVRRPAVARDPVHFRLIAASICKRR